MREPDERPRCHYLSYYRTLTENRQHHFLSSEHLGRSRGEHVEGGRVGNWERTADQDFLDAVERHVRKGWEVESLSAATLRAYVRLVRHEPRRWWQRRTKAHLPLGTLRLISIDASGDVQWADVGRQVTAEDSSQPVPDPLVLPGVVGRSQHS